MAGDQIVGLVGEKVRARKTAFAQALILHLLLLGGIMMSARLVFPPEPVVYLNCQMLELPAESSPRPQSQVTGTVKTVSAPAETAPSQPQLAPPPVVERQPTPAPPRKTRSVPEPAPTALGVKPVPSSPPAPMNPEPVAAVAANGQPPSPETAEPDVGLPVAAPVGKGVDGGAPADERYRRANFTAIREAILGNLQYPMLARRRGWSGQVEVSFTISPDGAVSELRILASSGYAILDEQAVTAIRRSAPFTPPPPVSTVLIMPVTFRLN